MVLKPAFNMILFYLYKKIFKDRSLYPPFKTSICYLLGPCISSPLKHLFIDNTHRAPLPGEFSKLFQDPV